MNLGARADVADLICQRCKEAVSAQQTARTAERDACPAHLRSGIIPTPIHAKRSLAVRISKLTTQIQTNVTLNVVEASTGLGNRDRLRTVCAVTRRLIVKSQFAASLATSKAMDTAACRVAPGMDRNAWERVPNHAVVPSLNSRWIPNPSPPEPRSTSISTSVLKACRLVLSQDKLLVNTSVSTRIPISRRAEDVPPSAWAWIA